MDQDQIERNVVLSVNLPGYLPKASLPQILTSIYWKIVKFCGFGYNKTVYHHLLGNRHNSGANGHV